MRVLDLDSHRLIPLIRQRRQFAIKGRAQSFDNSWQRIAEIFILAASEAVTPHDDAAAEHALFRIQAREPLTLFRSQYSFEQDVSLIAQFVRNLRPVQLFEPSEGACRL